MIANKDGGVPRRKTGPSAPELGRRPEGYRIEQPRSRDGRHPRLDHRGPEPRRVLAWRARRGHDPRIRVRPADDLPRPTRRPRCAQDGPDDPRGAEPRRRLVDLSRRPGQHQRDGQGVLRPEAPGHLDRRPVDGPGSRGDPPAPAGPEGLQQLHPVLPGAPRADPLRRGALRPSRADARAVEDALQPGGHVVLDTDDHRPLDDHLGLQAGPSAPSRTSRSPSCSPKASPRRRASIRPSRGRTSSSSSTRLSRSQTRSCQRSCGSRRSRRRIAGCSPTSRTPTAWARSSRR